MCPQQTSHSKADSITAADVTRRGGEEAGKKQWEKRQRERGQDGAKSEDGKMAQGGGENKIKRTVEERKKEGEFEAIVSSSPPL